MKAFIGLVKKDLGLMKFWSWMGLLFFGMAGMHIFSGYISEPELMFPFMMAAVLILAPLLLLYTLRVEGKTQLWLYNPQSSLKLLLAKLGAAAIIQLIAQLFISFYALFFMRRAIAFFSSALPIDQGIISLQLHIFGTAMHVSVLFMFLWTVYHSLGKYPAIRHFRWLAVVLVWLSYHVLVERQLWKLPIFQNSLSLFTLMYAILSIIFFLLASRLLDRKVEV
ncbi:hypothetical protein MHB50_12930 [Siminovitchia sp. FSL H7-0308]|uniref:Glucan phosphoethanolaminetransferase (Alkaline phosphatase superfamily) n=1 Tax=Siminovitchia thermophila TaxID=1245522 RepID=A0ABS2R141_9BACI|nr:hypothetical protein [Siminovitchia thermophila]MBM7713085.1 glucan phosphoethanolaminetransferase (alkaline phosphatase superfamily) [Siminovitchia thermophila]ONK24876.1 hypothetical protein BLX87_03335 [Bacillus sp. VT-16-64]